MVSSFSQGWSIFVCLVENFQSIPEERASFRCGGAGHLPLKICPRDACLGWGSGECRLSEKPFGPAENLRMLLPSCGNYLKYTSVSSQESFGPFYNGIFSFAKLLGHVSRISLSLFLFFCESNNIMFTEFYTIH